jgi:hypothetical protein
VPGIYYMGQRSRYSDWSRAARPRVGVRVPVGSTIYSSPRCPGRLWGIPDFLPNRYSEGLSLGEKRAGREFEHSPLASVEVKKTWMYTPTSTDAFVA